MLQPTPMRTTPTRAPVEYSIFDMMNRIDKITDAILTPNTASRSCKSCQSCQYSTDALGRDDRAGRRAARRADDPALYGRADGPLRGDIIGEHLVHDVTSRRAAGENRIAVTSSRHEVVFCDEVGR